MRTIRIALCQINTVVGDIPGNTEKIIRWLDHARDRHVDLVAFPELATTGYPPEDLLLKPSFIEDNRRALDRIIAATSHLTAIVGFVDSDGDTFNAAAVIHDRCLAGVHHKHYLPNYGVFDEVRYFQPGNQWQVFHLDGVTFGANVCEDIWYPGGPLHDQAIHGDAELIINISASPYHAGKGKARERMIATRASDHTAVVAYCNLVGGQDELIFDGQSLIVDQNGELIARGLAFEEDLVIADIDINSVFRLRLHDPRRRKEKATEESARVRVQRINLHAFPEENGDNHDGRPSIPHSLATPPHPTEEIYRALVLGTRDYVAKNRFQKVCIGLSGGIDSALVAAIAVDALGAENVTCVFMPSQYSSVESREDAEQACEYLRVKLMTLDIQKIFEASLGLLKCTFEGTPPGTAEENLQARIRGNLLMALSNKFGWLVLTTGNKSEMSVGYCTIYGDTAGGLAVIKDCPKTLVYALSRFRTSLGRTGIQPEVTTDTQSRFLLGPPGPVIPDRILTKEPTAELRPNQKDSDTLPPYEILDNILKRYVEEDQSPPEIVAAGFDNHVVQRVIRMVDRAEYKRRQAPPGIKITPRALGKDRRLPITNAYA